MKIPEKAPANHFETSYTFISILGKHEDVLDPIFEKANKDYLYWDKFKYLTFPEEVTPEIAWSGLKVMRGINSLKEIPLLDLKTRSTFNYWLPDWVHEALHHIDQDAGGHLNVGDGLLEKEEKQTYIMKSLMEEAITSSQLEGAVTTRAVAKEMLRSGRKPRDHAEKMIFNNYNTIREIKEHLNEELSPALIKTLHGLMTQETLETRDEEGRFRKAEDGPINVFDSSGIILHTPPPPKDIEKSIKLLCDFANEKDKKTFVHPVVRGILIHFWLAYLHPFIDGNGRTARALFYWYMLKKGYWLFEYLSISKIILDAPNQYYRAFLYTELDESDVTYFITYHIRAIEKAKKTILNYLSKKMRESRNAKALLENYQDLNHRQRALLVSALEKPKETYTFAAHKQVHGIVYQSARSDLLSLTEKGLLEMRQQGKKFLFNPIGNLKEKLLGIKK